MIKYDKFVLDNGLTVIVHQDKSTPFVCMNILYKVGAIHENPERTGFAHLFEHLMFGGSTNIPDYDSPLQVAGGDNNAFTTSDFTNYYLNLPKENIETAFWLESDRMLSLDFNQKSLDTQKNVVIEEFKQRYFNQPYGDVWLYLRPLAYKEHPYQWPVIGKKTEHIAEANLDNVKDFFFSHYAPNNAIMCVSGNVETENIKSLSEKWFGDIPRRKLSVKDIKKEPKQKEARFLKLERDIPLDAIYKAYHMCDKNNKEFFATDLLSDVLSNGESSRLYQNLVKEKQIFQSIDAYLSGEVDEGLFIFSGKLAPNIDIELAEKELQKEINMIREEVISEYELEKVKNKVISNLIYSEVSYMNKALNLCHYELLGNAEQINQQAEQYKRVSKDDIQNIAKNILNDTNCSTIHYLKKR
ncbi:MAG: insulinase family protein [Marinifilaceae bacterium]|jgi:predicted Zn-dependent peptidase|nr:insulinase family protein [Marinifilaceae bacterium]